MQFDKEGKVNYNSLGEGIVMWERHTICMGSSDNEMGHIKFEIQCT